MPSLLFMRTKFQATLPLLAEKLLANKIDGCVGFNLLKPAYLNEMIVKGGT
jgi:hypothetical protein